MKHKTFLLLQICIVLLLFSCEKEDLKPLPEPGYPTTYDVLSVSEWNLVDSDFQKLSKHSGLQINNYGFVEGVAQWGDFDTITADLVVSVIDSLVSSYGKFLGIPVGEEFDFGRDILIDNPNLIPRGRSSVSSFFEHIEQFGNDLLEGVDYKVYLNQIRIHDKYTIGVDLCFAFKPEANEIFVSGHWIPDALVPKSSIYSEQEAFSIARKEIRKRLGEDIAEIKDEIHSYPVLLKIFKDENIEIRDCWRIGKLDLVSGYAISVFVDKQTGEIVNFKVKDYYNSN